MNLHPKFPNGAIAYEMVYKTRAQIPYGCIVYAKQ